MRNSILKTISIVLLSTLTILGSVGVANAFRGTRAGSGWSSQGFANGKDIASLLRPIQGLTFVKLFKSNSGTKADFAIGSPVGTFTRTSSASAPATVVKGNGIIDIVTTSDLVRNLGSYYDTNGNTIQQGLMVEASGTNLLTRTDGTAASGGVWTGWTILGSATGTITKSNTAIPELTSIVGAKSQRIQYTGIVTDTNKLLYLESTQTLAASVAPGNIVTISLWMRSLTGNTGTLVRPAIDWRDNTGTEISLTYSSNLLSSLTTSWKKFTVTGTAPALTDRVSFPIVIDNIDNGDAVDFEVYAPQLEINPYATSWIPTTTAALTRGAEVLKYETTGNRTAAAETIFIKFAPESVFASDGIQRYLTTSDTKERQINKNASSTKLNSYSNATDNAAVTGVSTTIPAANTSYMSTSVIQHASPYVQSYINGISEGTYTVGDFTSNAWGTYWYVGSALSSASQLNGIIQCVVIFSRALSASEILYVSNLLNSN